MKKSIIVLCALFTTSLLMAGGDVPSNLSPVAGVPAQSCKENKIYMEEDEQLMWEDQAYTVAENGAFKNRYSIGKAGTHSHAVAYCSHLDYMGYSDWRLPTSDELTKVHYRRGRVFSYSRDNDFWTSTPTTENRFYVVFPADAYRYPRTKSQSNFIRCVRCTANDK